MTPLAGVDASYDRPAPTRLAAAGKRFFVGYVSPQPAKNITPEECAAFRAAGCAVCLVWESTGREVLGGYARGLTDAGEARRQARLLGFPADRPIYHAIDFDATAAQLAGPIADYFRGAAAAAGTVALLGVYGGIRQIGYLLDHALVGYAWQTYAWSGGKWDTRAQAQQYSNNHQLAGGTVDLDRAVADDYGQWEPDMPLTSDDVTRTWTQDGIIDNRSWRADAKTNLKIQPASAVEIAMDEAHAASVKADQILAAIGKMASPTVIAAAVVAALPSGGSGTLTEADVEAAVHAALSTLTLTAQ